MLTRKKLWYSLGGIAVLTIFCALVVWPQVPGNNAMSQWFSRWKFHLGLDLQGGTHLVYEADTSKIEDSAKADALAGVRDVLERRINVFGVSEPVVQTNKVGDKWRVIIELPGVKEVAKAIEMIGETPLLEFKEQNTAGATDNDKEMVKAKETLKQILATPAKFDEIAKQQQDDKLAVFTKEISQFKDEIPADIVEKIWNMKAGEIVKEPISGVDGYTMIDDQLTPMNGFFVPKVIAKKTSVNREVKNDKEVEASHILIAWAGTSNSSSTRTQKEAKELAEVILKKAQAEGADFAQLAKENSDDPTAADNGGALGFFKAAQMVKPFSDVAFAMEKGQISKDLVETEFGYHIVKVTDIKAESTTQTKEDQLTYSYLFYQTTVDPWQLTGLSGKNLKSATVEFDPTTGEPRVALEFDDEGKKLFADITQRNVGKPVAIFLDGQSISQPTVEEAILDGSAVISGRFSITEAKLLGQRLQAGALPVSITLLSQQNIGPSLGKSSLDKSLQAGIIGLLAVALFMILYYRLPGVLAVLALGVYGLLNLAIFETLPVTLTLAGIAGFILSIGMAVDANVLIFERFKEERRAGKPVNEAISEGFRRAWPSIRDGNASTLITCVILYYFGTSSIKGFGLTLGIGVLTSMFSAITVSRVLLLLVAESPLKKWDWLWGARKKEVIK